MSYFFLYIFGHLTLKYKVYIYIYNIITTYTRFKSKIHDHQVRQVFRTWDLNQQEFVQRDCDCEQQCSW